MQCRGTDGCLRDGSPGCTGWGGVPGFSMTWQCSLQTLLVLTCCLAHAGHSGCSDDQDEAPPFTRSAGRPAHTAPRGSLLEPLWMMPLGTTGPAWLPGAARSWGTTRHPSGFLSAQGTGLLNLTLRDRVRFDLHPSVGKIIMSGEKSSNSRHCGGSKGQSRPRC